MEAYRHVLVVGEPHEAAALSDLSTFRMSPTWKQSTWTGSRQTTD
jgi:hypothetical protein